MPVRNNRKPVRAIAFNFKVVSLFNLRMLTFFRTAFLHINLSPLSRSWLLCGLLIFGLSACGNANVSDLENYVAEQKSLRKGRIEPIPPIPEYVTYAYNSKDLRAPFSPIRKEPTEPCKKGKSKKPCFEPDRDRKPEVLEQFALDSLSLVGSLEQEGERWALIKSNDGILHRKKIGNYIGFDNGLITQINENYIYLLEIVTDGLGGWVKRKTVLKVTGQSQ